MRIASIGIDLGKTTGSKPQVANEVYVEGEWARTLRQSGQYFHYSSDVNVLHRLI
jgi:hypothetical protein